MEDLPPPGSDRRRIAIGIWFALTVLFAVLLAVGVYKYVRGEMGLPALLAAATSVGFVIHMWLRIAERSRPDAPAPDPQREAVGRWVFWMIFFAAFLALGLYKWAMGEEGYLFVLVIGGVGTAISARRWIVAKSRLHAGP